MVACPSCGQENPAGFRLCGMCGAPLQEEAPPREERKVVTVLFCDLVGSTARAERMDPEDVRALLSRYHERVRTELERFGGTVEKFIGDAVMALFGAPVAHEDDPERAVRAALAVRDALEGELAIRVGITTGETLIALGARPERGEAMAAGDVVNNAARLQAAAPENAILVDETTYRATDRVIEYTAAAPVEAKGKSEPMKAWQAQHARSRFGVDVRQVAATPLVGRQREQTLLAETLARVKEERSPQLVTLVGVPGIGKSRLVWELFQHIRSGSELVTWRQGRSLPYGEGAAFWALGEIVKAQAGILETDAVAAAQEKLGSAVHALISDDRDAGWVERHLRTLVGLDAAESAGDRGESFAAWRRFVEALAEQRPLVLVFEDLHFADDALLDFVDHLVEWATSVPMLVVATARPELLQRRPSWGGGKSNAVTISLSPLSDDETARIVHALLERSVLDADLQWTVLERAGGNPLYAEEFARLVAAGREPAELPETVQGIVAARLDLLSPEEKRVLHDAAVVGKVFWLGAVAAMGGGERWSLEQQLHALERKEFVRRERASSVAGESEYAFRHILVRDVAYAQIPRNDRVDKHLRAARWIESLGRREDHAGTLAHHYIAALDLAAATGAVTPDVNERARVAVREAGERALALHAHAAAIQFFERALQLMSDDDPDRAELLLSFGRALHLAGDERAPDVLARARDELASRGARPRAAEACALLAELWWYRGQRERSHEQLEHARELVAGEAASESTALVLAQVARYKGLAGDRETAVAAASEATAMAEDLSLDEVVVHALTSHGTALCRMRDPAGLAKLERAVELGEAINSPMVMRAYNNLGTLLIESFGDHERGRALIREAVRAAERFGNPVQARFSSAILIWDDHENGNWDAFVANARAFLDESARLGGAYQDAYFVATLSRVALARDEEDEAREHLQRAVETARHIGDPQIVLSVLESAAFVEASLGNLAAARAHAREVIGGGEVSVQLALFAEELGIADDLRALADAEADRNRWAAAALLLLDGDPVGAADVLAEIGSRPLEAYARVAAAKTFVAEGRRKDADEQLARALAFWRSVRATRHIREAEQLLAATA